MIKTRAIVFAGVLAAAYVVLTWALAPISFGPLQFRIAEVLKPAALFSPYFALAFAFGNGIANIMSPFGAWDFIGMAIVDGIAAYVCWLLRSRPWIGVIVQAVMISAGVAALPLGIVAGLPFVPTFLSVLVSELILLAVGYQFIWRRYGPMFMDLVDRDG